MFRLLEEVVCSIYGVDLLKVACVKEPFAPLMAMLRLRPRYWSFALLTVACGEGPFATLMAAAHI